MTKKKLRYYLFSFPDGDRVMLGYRPGTRDVVKIERVLRDDRYRLQGLRLKKGDTVVVVGAYTGASVLLLAHLYPGLRIHAWEALKANFELLQKNVEGIRYDGEIHLHREAIWAWEEGKVKVYYGDNSGFGKLHKYAGRLFCTHPGYAARVFEAVEQTNLSTAFKDNRITECALLVLAAGGAEYGILKAAPEGVLKMIRRIHGSARNPDPEKIRNVREALLGQTKGGFVDETEEADGPATSRFVFERR